MDIHDYDFIFNLSKADVAGVLTACGYAIRESITLIDSLEELGFSNIDIGSMEDIDGDRQLTSLAIRCLSRLYRKQRNQIQIGDRVKHPDFQSGVIKVVDFTQYKSHPNNPWVEIEFECAPNKRAIGPLKTLEFLGWQLREE